MIFPTKVTRWYTPIIPNNKSWLPASPTSLSVRDPDSVRRFLRGSFSRARRSLGGFLAWIFGVDFLLNLLCPKKHGWNQWKLGANFRQMRIDDEKWQDMVPPDLSQVGEHPSMFILFNFNHGLNMAKFLILHWIPSVITMQLRDWYDLIGWNLVFRLRKKKKKNFFRVTTITTKFGRCSSKIFQIECSKPSIVPYGNSLKMSHGFVGIRGGFQSRMIPIDSELGPRARRCEKLSGPRRCPVFWAVFGQFFSLRSGKSVDGFLSIEVYRSNR